MSRTYVGVDVEMWVPDQGIDQVHHLRQDKEISEVVGDFLGHELDKVRHKLVQPWVVAETGKSCRAIFDLLLVENSLANFFKIQL